MYELRASYKITKEQNNVVNKIVNNFKVKTNKQVLLGVTGSGKTFTVANIIERLNVPVLVLSPNKTLAAQLYQEFRSFFPNNRVGYFISYYDYYQPEAFVPQKNLYIAKEVSINPELERLRIYAARSILESRNTIIIASVSSIYSIGSPDDFFNQKINYFTGMNIKRDNIINDFVKSGYKRTEGVIEPLNFRVRGNIIEIYPSGEDYPIRFIFDDNKLVLIEVFDNITSYTIKEINEFSLFPVSYFFYKENRIKNAIGKIKQELEDRIKYFKSIGKPEFAQRIKERTMYDMEMLQQYGHCSGIENYSLYLSDRKPGSMPYTLMDFFSDDFLTVIDESHITIPQLRGMYEGDRSRKQKLVDYGFRLPSALDNRPLRFDEFTKKVKRALYVSATPSEFEINDSKNNVVELLVRPTGLIDPCIELRNVENPVNDMIKDINIVIRRKERILITTLTKKMAERLTDYLTINGFKVTYMHSDIKPLDRVSIIKKLRQGKIDILIGINLLREGLDLPEVSLIIVLEGDREGYLRSQTSLIQIFGRAARNLNGKVIIYYKSLTKSLKSAISETDRRRKYQLEYNKKNNIIPKTITSSVKEYYTDDYWINVYEKDLNIKYKTKESLEKAIKRTEDKMKLYSNRLEFKKAIKLREELIKLKNMLINFY